MSVSDSAANILGYKAQIVAFQFASDRVTYF